jgi:hypothetical protein
MHCFLLASFPVPCAQLQTLSSLLGWGGLRLVFWLFLLVVCLVNESHMKLWLRSGFPVLPCRSLSVFVCEHVLAHTCDKHKYEAAH